MYRVQRHWWMLVAQGKGHWAVVLIRLARAWNWMHAQIIRARVQLIRLLVGKLSIVANTKLDGSIAIGSGGVWNCHFKRGTIDAPLLPGKGIAYCARIRGLAGITSWIANNVIESKTFYVGPTGDDAADGLSFATRKRTLKGIDAVALPGDMAVMGEADETDEAITCQRTNC
jgi:hypothetical protein